jgi:tetraacyldisaccharide 4'-kinase
MSALKTPAFWYRRPEDPPAPLESALAPLSRLYAFFYRLHQSSKTPYRSTIPVACIGNVVAGGTGKTPTALALMDLIRQAGLAQNPHFLIRGYGGSERGPVLVDPLMHSAWEVGDEALILVRSAPTIVAADRAAGAQFAERRGADLLLMDDGLQNPGLHKDLKIIVLNGEMGFGNKRLIPAGPLRQPLGEGLGKADAFILIGPDTRGALADLPAGKPILRAALRAKPSQPIDTSARYIAFAGLGYPDKFFNFLKESVKLDIVDTVRFADHCPYGESDLRMLEARARAHNARLITTEKDFLRIPKINAPEIDVIPVEMAFENEDDLRALLISTLRRPQ